MPDGNARRTGGRLAEWRRFRSGPRTFRSRSEIAWTGGGALRRPRAVSGRSARGVGARSERDRVVGVSFEGPLLPSTASSSCGRSRRSRKTASRLPVAGPRHERFKVLISELRLYLEDVEPNSGAWRASSPGMCSMARIAGADSADPTDAFHGGGDILRASEEIDAASRNAPPDHAQAMVQCPDATFMRC